MQTTSTPSTSSQYTSAAFPRTPATLKPAPGKNTKPTLTPREQAETLTPFLSRSQQRAIAAGLRGEEASYFRAKFLEMAQVVATMHKTYEQQAPEGDDSFSPIAHLHYFSRGSDWYITEKDMDGGIDQAFGYAILNGNDQFAELGYISIRELTANGVELDLHFTPLTIDEIKAKRAAR